MNTKSPESAENQDQTVAPDYSNLLDAFEDSFVVSPEESDKKESTVTPPSADKQIAGGEAKSDDGKTDDKSEEAEFDEALLDMELKRFEDKTTLKQFIAKNPDLVKEIMQKGWDYDARKKELKEQIAKEREVVESEKNNINIIRLRNLAFEISKPLKTLEDFENDMRTEDAEKEYEQYLADFKQKAMPLVAKKKEAEEANTEMIEDFARQYKDVDVKELFGNITPYLNASVAMGYEAFPKDALEVFYKGKNFDKLVEQKVTEAREDERKKVYAEIKNVNGKSNLNKLPNSQNADKKKIQSGDAILDFFENEAWNV